MLQKVDLTREKYCNVVPVMPVSDSEVMTGVLKGISHWLAGVWCLQHLLSSSWSSSPPHLVSSQQRRPNTPHSLLTNPSRLSPTDGLYMHDVFLPPDPRQRRCKHQDWIWTSLWLGSVTLRYSPILFCKILFQSCHIQFSCMQSRYWHFAVLSARVEDVRACYAVCFCDLIFCWQFKGANGWVSIILIIFITALSCLLGGITYHCHATPTSPQLHISSFSTPLTFIAALSPLPPSFS